MSRSLLDVLDGEIQDILQGGGDTEADALIEARAVVAELLVSHAELIAQLRSYGPRRIITEMALTRADAALAAAFAGSSDVPEEVLELALSIDQCKTRAGVPAVDGEAVDWKARCGELTTALASVIAMRPELHPAGRDAKDEAS